MNYNLKLLKNRLDSLEVDYGDYIDDIDSDISELEDIIGEYECTDTPDCDFCDKCVRNIDPDQFYLDLHMLEAQYTLKEISDETHKYCKSLLDNYIKEVNK